MVETERSWTDLQHHLYNNFLLFTRPNPHSDQVSKHKELVSSLEATISYKSLYFVTQALSWCLCLPVRRKGFNSYGSMTWWSIRFLHEPICKQFSSKGFCGNQEIFLKIIYNGNKEKLSCSMWWWVLSIVQ